VGLVLMSIQPSPTQMVVTLMTKVLLQSGIEMSTTNTRRPELKSKERYNIHENVTGQTWPNPFR
jgi:hypothetical protein